MKLTEFIKQGEIAEEIQNRLTPKEINKILYSDIEDTGEIAEYAIVFGSYYFIKPRAQKAVDLYKKRKNEENFIFRRN